MVWMNEKMNNWQCNVYTYECTWKNDGERMNIQSKQRQCEQIYFNVNVF